MLTGISTFQQQLTFANLVSADSNISIGQTSGTVSALTFDLKPGGNFTNVNGFNAIVVNATNTVLTKDLQITGVCTFVGPTSLNADQTTATFSDVSTNTLSANNNQNFIEGPAQFRVGILTANGSVETGSLTINDSSFTNSAGDTFEFSLISGIGTEPSILQITCSNSSGTVQGSASLVLEP